MRVGEGRIYTYTDDMMLLAMEEDKIKSTIGRFKNYLKRKRLELNTGK